ncbi:MAG TPA: hypothetical protein VEQ85_11715 [Lacipirellulaceae bacterium]|nr:hypothetical protein [Lacipirellulaceae bacterium]
MSQRDCVVGIFPSTESAHESLEKLEGQGWRSDQLSLIARGNEERLGVLASHQHGDVSEKSAAMGSAVGAGLGLLAGSSLFIIPGLGPVLFAGAMASGITGGLVGGLVGAMGGWGIKDDSVQKYEDALKQGKAVLVLTGDPEQLARGRAELLASSAETVEMHAESADSDHVDP